MPRRTSTSIVSAANAMPRIANHSAMIVMARGYGRATIAEKSLTEPASVNFADCLMP